MIDSNLSAFLRLI